MTTEQVKQKAPTRRVSDLLGDGHVSFHDGLPRIEIRAILNVDVGLLEIKPMRGWSGQFGTRDWYLLLVSVGGDEFTTKVGGQVINGRLEDLLRRRALPITAQFRLEGEGDRMYFNVI